MLARSSLLFLVVGGLSLGLSLGCSSNKPSQNTPPAEDTGTEEDTAPVEDTAPWNTYPEGPYGILSKGQTFPNLKFKGYKDGTGEWTDISMQDYYDPTGERGIYGILVVVSAEWCPPCREEAKDLPRFYQNLYKPRGAKFLTTMIEDNKRNPAEQPVIDRWVKTYGINFDIAADPDATTLPEADSGIPRNYIINPRDMKIVRINKGVNPDAEIVPGLATLLNYLGAPPAPDAGTPDTGPTDSASDTPAD